LTYTSVYLVIVLYTKQGSSHKYKDPLEYRPTPPQHSVLAHNTRPVDCHYSYVNITSNPKIERADYLRRVLELVEDERLVAAVVRATGNVAKNFFNALALFAVDTPGISTAGKLVLTQDLK
jgi:hypothetical protein